MENQDSDLSQLPILIAIPDDLGKIVSIYLQQKKLSVKTIYSYSDALEFLLSNPVRGIITVSEWAVPDEEGLFHGLFEESEKKIPIIVLVRRENFHHFFTQYHKLFNSPYDPSLARDDYVTIPFDPGELFHRMQMVGIVDDGNVTQMSQLFKSEIITAILDGIASIPDSSEQDKIMNQLVEVIREKGGFYFVSLYLVDVDKKWVILRAGTGAMGEVLLSTELKYRLDSSSIIGNAVFENDIKLLDYNHREAWFASPLLPETRWELAVPLRVEQEVIGVLKIDGMDKDGFELDKAKPIQQVADRVAEKLGCC